MVIKCSAQVSDSSTLIIYACELACHDDFKDTTVAATEIFDVAYLSLALHLVVVFHFEYKITRQKIVSIITSMAFELYQEHTSSVDLPYLLFEANCYYWLLSAEPSLV